MDAVKKYTASLENDRFVCRQRFPLQLGVALVVVKIGFQIQGNVSIDFRYENIYICNLPWFQWLKQYHIICAGIGPLQLSVVLVYFYVAIWMHIRLSIACFIQIRYIWLIYDITHRSKLWNLWRHLMTSQFGQYNQTKHIVF